MTSCTKSTRAFTRAGRAARRRALVARTGLLVVALSAGACGDGDKLSARSDGGLPLEVEGGTPGEMDARVADGQVELDGQVGDMDATTDADANATDASTSDANTSDDGSTSDGAIPVTDSGVLPDGGVCPTGFVLMGAVCLDIDECAPGGGATCAAPTTYCVNSPGSYACACALGEALVGNVCQDIDECTLGTHQCDPGVTCTNLSGPGRYTCGGCLAGQVGGANGVCLDFNECTLGNACVPGASCSNAAPSVGSPTPYACTCPTGFNGDGIVSCDDVDECSNNSDNCPTASTCGNTVGSFTCTCTDPGFALTGTGNSLACTNLDECLANTDTCDPRVVCMDTVGSFTCSACPAGYAGDPSMLTGCADIDECDPLNPVHNCTGGASSCINDNGGFTCGVCPPGTELGGPLLDVCIDVDECARDLDDCGPNAVCTNVAQPVKWTCSCPPGFAGDPTEQTDGCVVTPLDTPTLSSGYRHTCAVLPDQSIDCWGTASSGSTTPPSGTGVSAVTNGLDFSCALYADKSVSCWGDSWAGQAPALRAGRYEQIAAGERNVCGILDDRTLSCWGRNDTDQSSPPPGLYRSIAAGSLHACAIGFARDITCWGAPGGGRTAAPDGNNFTQLSLGAEHGCALDNTGVAQCWGANSQGQSTIPAGLGTLRQVTAGGYFSCALKLDRTVTCWGSPGSPGIPGDPIADVPTTQTFAAISAGNTHVCGITTPAGEYVCWGENQYGQVQPSP